MKWMIVCLLTGCAYGQTIINGTGSTINNGFYEDSQIRLVGAPFVAGQPVASLPCPASVSTTELCIGPATVKGAAGIAIQDGVVGRRALIALGGAVSCNFDGNPIKLGDFAAVGNGVCYDSGQQIADFIPANVPVFKRIIAILDSTHAIVNVSIAEFGKGAVKLSYTDTSPAVDASPCVVYADCQLAVNLAANASLPITGFAPTQQFTLMVCNGPTAATWTPPSNLKGAMTVPIGPNTCNVQRFTAISSTIARATNGGINEAL